MTFYEVYFYLLLLCYLVVLQLPLHPQ